VISPEATAAAIIAANRYLTLATTGPDGPWASPLAFTIEPDFSLIFYSATESRHCQNIAANPQVAGAIFDSTSPSNDADGVQFTGRCGEVAENELAAVMERYFSQSFPDPEIRKRWLRPIADFQHPAPQRFYRIIIERLFKPDPASTKIDQRLELDIAGVGRLCSV
jgi:uncharacterized protein YhbP (UPF0306 family)